MCQNYDVIEFLFKFQRTTMSFCTASDSIVPDFRIIIEPNWGIPFYTFLWV